MTQPIPHHEAVVVGGGQAGLAMSWVLKQRGIGHVIFEKHQVAQAWRAERWDSFCLVTPNWQCLLPGFSYAGDDPNGFMLKHEIIRYIEDYAAMIDAPLREGVTVTSVARDSDRFFRIETSQGPCTADSVVIAAGGYHQPAIPRIAERLPDALLQLHSSQYRNPEILPDGEVLVIGSGQSGCQIAEDLHLAGRKVHLAVGSAPRCPRRYRGKDAVDWLADMGYYDMAVERHPAGEKVRARANHYVTGRDGGREIDLRKFATEGMRLYGRLDSVGAGRLAFADDLARRLDEADQTYNGIRAAIDAHIAENRIAAPVEPPYLPPWAPDTDTPRTIDLAETRLGTVIWSTGFRTDFSWIDLPAFKGSGYPAHRRGVTPVAGLYFLGLPWLHTWGSGRFSGVARDAEHIGEALARHVGADQSIRLAKAG